MSGGALIENANRGDTRQWNPCGGSKEGRVSFQRGKNGFIEKGALRLALRGSYEVRDGV